MTTKACCLTSRHYAADVLSGGISLDQVPEKWLPTVQSLLQLPIYKRADAVLAADTKDARRAIRDNQPESIRAMDETEARRLFEQRRKAR